MTDSFPGDTAMLEITIPLSGSTAASERSFDVRRPLQGPDANQLKTGKSCRRDDA
jgi:hypothetical protein